MSKNYGMMIGCKDAIMWVKNLSGVNEMLRSRVVARMEYEFDKDVPVPMKYHKGLYGKNLTHIPAETVAMDWEKHIGGIARIAVSP